MSLTQHLGDAGSPIRAYIDGISPALSDACGGKASAHSAAGSLGLVGLAEQELVVRPPASLDVSRTGVALDIRTRIELDGFDPHASTASMGLTAARSIVEEVSNGHHRAQILGESFDVASRLLADKSDVRGLDRAALILAQCEQVYRGGARALAGSLGEALDNVETGLELVAGVDVESLGDLRRLMETNVGQLEAWRGQIMAGERFDPNPVFSGSMLVGGADGDWIIGDVLIDCKAYTSLTVSKLRGFIRQLLGYVMLDLDDALKIRRVGVWLARQRQTMIWSLDRLLGGNPDELLPKMREGFQAAVKGNQLAVYEPASERRKRQILADNKHTPAWMLSNLARSEDRDIRFRVGRNMTTPEGTLRKLSQDTYAKPREGVAHNEAAPIDVLIMLAHDKSIVVRRAAATNPSSPTDGQRTLEAASAAVMQSDSDESSFKSITATSLDEHSPVRISLDHDDGLYSRWFFEFLVFVRDARTQRPGSHLPVPTSRWCWGRAERQQLEAPDWLKRGLPQTITNDLLGEHRPAWIRRLVADGQSVHDSRTLRRLLEDTDPEIRWSTLLRTMDISNGALDDDYLSGLLEELAISRQARVRFRTEGEVRHSWKQDLTRAELDRETLCLVAGHPSTPQHTLKALAAIKSTEVFIALIENPALSPGSLASLLPRLKTIRPVNRREQLAGSQRLRPEVATVLAADQNVFVRVELAGNKRTDRTLLERLAGDKDVSIKLTVLANRNTPPGVARSIAVSTLSASSDHQLLEALQTIEKRDDLDLPPDLFEDALERLSKNRLQNLNVRQIVASDLHTGPQTLTRLAMSADESVRSAVAGNARTPIEVLDKLANDSSPRVRSSAAGNNALNPDLLLALAYDDDTGVRASAAGNPGLPPVTLSKLLVDDAWPVRDAATHNPTTRDEDITKAAVARDSRRRESAPSREELGEWIAKGRAEVRVQIAADPGTPPDILALLGGERRSVRVRRTVAVNPNTPSSVLTSLVEDKDDEVRQGVAANPRTPPTSLGVLAEDESLEVRQLVAFNRSTPTSILIDLAGRSVDLALLVALNPHTPVSILTALSKDSDSLVEFVATGARESRAAVTSSSPASEIRSLTTQVTSEEKQEVNTKELEL